MIRTEIREIIITFRKRIAIGFENKGSSLTIVNEGSSLTIDNEWLSLTIVNETTNFIKTVVFGKKLHATLLNSFGGVKTP